MFGRLLSSFRGAATYMGIGALTWARKRPTLAIMTTTVAGGTLAGSSMGQSKWYSITLPRQDIILAVSITTKLYMILTLFLFIHSTSIPCQEHEEEYMLCCIS